MAGRPATEHPAGGLKTAPSDRPLASIRMERTEVVRAAFEAYLTQDRAAMDALLADDYVFTSPQDDHIDRDAFLERCFPTADRVESQVIVDLVETPTGAVCIVYEYVLRTGERHRNVEYITVRGDQLAETQVFFGGRV